MANIGLPCGSSELVKYISTNYFLLKSSASSITGSTALGDPHKILSRVKLAEAPSHITMKL